MHHHSVLSHTPTHPGSEVVPEGLRRERERERVVAGGVGGGGGGGGAVGGELDDMAWNGDEGRFDVELLRNALKEL